MAKHKTILFSKFIYLFDIFKLLGIKGNREKIYINIVKHHRNRISNFSFAKIRI